MTNPNDTAFPESHPECPSPGKGLTKREYFAAMAMQGILAGGGAMNEIYAADRCILFSDALIEALNK